MTRPQRLRSEGIAMNWILTIRNKAGLISKIGYTNKTIDQIESIKDRWIDEGMEVIQVSRKG